MVHRGVKEPCLEVVTREEFESRLGGRISEAWDAYQRVWEFYRVYDSVVHQRRVPVKLDYWRDGQQYFYRVRKKGDS